MMTWAKVFIEPKITWFTSILAIILVVVFVLANDRSALGQIASGTVRYAPIDDQGTIGGWADEDTNNNISTDIYGGTSNGTIVITDGTNPIGTRAAIEITATVDYSVVGGYKTSGYGNASGNSVTINASVTIGNVGSETGSVYGGLSDVIGGHASDNAVTIKGVVGRNVYGGAAYVEGTNVKNNSVTLNNSGASVEGTTHGQVVGGAIYNTV
jgi:hypothetical protein